MVITNDNYIEFIDQLALSKIFTSDNNYEDLKADSIDEIVKYKKLKEEIDEYEKNLLNQKNI